MGRRRTWAVQQCARCRVSGPTVGCNPRALADTFSTHIWELRTEEGALVARYAGRPSFLARRMRPGSATSSSCCCFVVANQAQPPRLGARPAVLCPLTHTVAGPSAKISALAAGVSIIAGGGGGGAEQ